MSKIQVQNLVKPKNIMATRAKDTAPPGKEKRGTSPSHPIAHHLRSPNSSNTNSPVRKRADSTTSNKNVPNYLKPTMSSSNDPNIHNKPTLTRIRSFDKPPVAALQKTAKERILQSSSSFSGKTSSTSQKPLSDKLSRASHMTTGKQRGTSMYARPGTIKTTATGTISKKQEASGTSHNDTHKSRNDQNGHNGSTPKDPITNSSHAAEDVIPQAETGQDDTSKSRNDQEDHNESTPKESKITDSPHATEEVIPQAELSEQEDDQELLVTDTEGDVIINNSETAATDAGENNSAIEDQEEHNGNENNAEIVVENQEISKMEEPEDAHLVEETNTSNPKEPEAITNELNELHLEENTVKAVDENQQEKEEDKGRNQGKEGEAVQETSTTVASSKPQRQVVQGKKESVVSNDVIEETASKLREQRKNRVRALAGAFETVISLQEPKV
ncbi:suppressor protein SRP40 isoform X1 [Nicotiana tomentosiformis]|uniref:suppressor protein SRP40 isoform X1 n=2 Tax=Nicotiana tomentosiformis TaxID=4098 RepID=UPI00051B1FC1|nr:PREDICTED: suppressor of Mek1-like isoform X1 [Nicotiana tabacum]XP_033511917.1 SUN domain-containing protein 2-like isoform X1 [Nicotiana tomentosiformis]